MVTCNSSFKIKSRIFKRLIFVSCSSAVSYGANQTGDYCETWNGNRKCQMVNRLYFTSLARNSYRLTLTHKAALHSFHPAVHFYISAPFYGYFKLRLGSKATRKGLKSKQRFEVTNAFASLLRPHVFYKGENVLNK